MINLKNILNVATYERKTLYRSWFFKIFSLITLTVMFFLNMGFYANQWSSWDDKAISANMPYLNVLIVNVAQAVIAVFLASDFLQRDKKLDTTEVIYARPISNGEYVAGKTLGIIVLFVGLLAVVLSITLGYNILIKDIPVTWEAYLIYPLLISIPTLIFILGLSFFLMILFRSQAVTFIVLLGYIGLSLFYFKDKMYGSLDYMAFNIPMVYSDFIQFAELKMILYHRLAYLIMGLGFLFATIRFIPRLPQTGKWHGINLAGFVIFIALGGFLWFNYYNYYHQQSLEREKYLALNNSYAETPVVDVLSNHIKLKQGGSSLNISSALQVQNLNRSSLDTLIFSINPGFKIDSITGSSGKIEYFREKQILKLVPASGLAFMHRASYTFYYSGLPLESVAYLDIAKEDLAALKFLEVVNVDKKPCIADENFLLLTGECLWYPIAGVGFNTSNFQTAEPDFVRFSLEIQPSEGLNAVAPGVMTEEDGIQYFNPESDLNTLPLVIGPLEKRSMMIDDLEINLYLKPDHDFFTEYFPNLADTLSLLIKEAKEDYEYDELDLYYAFKRINLVEVPVQFHAYERPYKQTVDYVLPEMILFPEKGAGLSTIDFKTQKNIQERRNKERNSSKTPEEIEVDLFKYFITNTFFRSEFRIRFGFMQTPNQGQRILSYQSKEDMYTRNPFCVFPLFYNYVNGISSDEYPVFDAMIALYLKDGFEVSPRQSFSGGITSNEKANLALKGHSITSIFERWDSELSEAAIYQAGSFVMTALKNKVGSAEFDNFLYYYLEDRAFSEITFQSFARDFMIEFGVDIKPYMGFLSAGGDLPEFLVSTPELFQTRDDVGDVYVVRTSVTNKGGTEGLLELTFRLPGGGGFGGGGGMSTEDRLFEISPGETKDLQMVFYDQPRMMTINTLISANIPSNYSAFLRSATEKAITELVDYERNSDKQVSFTEENEIVVDNEDEGFSYVSVSNESKIKQFVNSRKAVEDDINYIAINSFWTPPVWTPVAHSAMYGETIRSALISRKGDGGNKAVWTTVLPEPGFYDLSVYIPVSAMYKMPDFRNRGGGGGENRQQGGRERRHGPEFADNGTKYTYVVSSNEGSEVVEFLMNQPEDGWNRIGTFHFPADTARVELSNNTNGARVIADAVKWEKRQ